MQKQIFTIKSLIESGLCPIKRTRLVTLIENGVKFQNKELPEGENYIIAWKAGDLPKSPWRIDGGEVNAWIERAKSRKLR